MKNFSSFLKKLKLKCIIIRLVRCGGHKTMKQDFYVNLLEGSFEDLNTSEFEQAVGRPQLTFMDPPDNEGRGYSGYDDKLSHDYYRCLLRQWTEKACRFTDGPVFVSIAERWVGEIEYLIRTNQVELIRRLYWHYTFGQNNKNSYSPCIRPMYWLNDPTIYPKEILVPSARQLKYNDKRANPAGKMPENMWEFPRTCGTFKERRKWHPTQHPEELIKRIILGHSKPDDTVFDPFIGSGTTALVCQATGRKCIGIDQSNFYLEKILEELANRK